MLEFKEFKKNFFSGLMATPTQVTKYQWKQTESLPNDGKNEFPHVS